MAAWITLLRSADQILLMGLDLPLPLYDRPSQEAIDAKLRSALDSAKLSYRVVYGREARRFNNAFFAINNIANQTISSSASALSDTKQGARATRLRTRDCEKCSDPECEHRLFTALLDHRA
ncbi:hypothetical protein [Acidovorax sp. 69]|uniref:hypothetical protein n=1 Tax=Acidovorax sp. 69 TaxID=2035202 RepID=UPI0012FDC01E|nr:hypothetical protein [Acidovorax sp. 69]